MPVKFAIDREAATPIFEQIAEQVRRGVAAGQFANGDPLPSVRSIAQELGVNAMTVSKAYGFLKREGLIGARPGGLMVVIAEGGGSLSESDRLKILRPGVVRLVIEAEQLRIGTAPLLSLVRSVAAERSGEANPPTERP